MALFATMLFLLLFSRAVFAFPILVIHNRLSKEPLTLQEVVIAWRARPHALCHLLRALLLSSLTGLAMRRL